MIEAVNSVVANASLLRGNVEQVDSSRSFGTDPERAQHAAPQAPYTSPYISVDLDANKAVLQIRDSETGDVLNQYPSETKLRAQSVAQDLPELSAPSSDAGVSGDAGDFGDVGGSNVVLAQQASVALSTGAQSGVESLSAGVSVLT